MKQVAINVSKCTGCNQCALTCAFIKTRTFDLRKSRIHVIQWEDICLSVPMLCQQCIAPACISACPTTALSRHPETNAILLDPEACDQCEQCVMMCTYQVMYTNLENLPVTCDLCAGDPACVKVCYPGALEFVEIAQEAREPFRAIADALNERSAGKNVLPPQALLQVARLVK